MVYDDAEKLYAEVRKDGEGLLEEAFSVLFPKSSPLSSAATKKEPGAIVGFNTTPFSRRDVVEIPLQGNATHLKSQVVQVSDDGKKGYALLDCSQGGHLAHTTGLYANCTPVSGRLSPMFERTSRLSYRSIHQRLRPLRVEECECPAHGLGWTYH